MRISHIYAENTKIRQFIFPKLGGKPLTIRTSHLKCPLLIMVECEPTGSQSRYSDVLIPAKVHYKWNNLIWKTQMHRQIFIRWLMNPGHRWHRFNMIRHEIQNNIFILNSKDKSGLYVFPIHCEPPYFSFTCTKPKPQYIIFNSIHAHYILFNWKLAIRLYELLLSL